MVATLSERSSVNFSLAPKQTQVIAAAEITQQTNDSRQLVPMVQQVVANVGSMPIAVSANTGYWSAANVTDESVTGVDWHIATGRQRHGEKVETVSGPPPEGASPRKGSLVRSRSGEDSVGLASGEWAMWAKSGR